LFVFLNVFEAVRLYNWRSSNPSSCSKQVSIDEIALGTRPFDSWKYLRVEVQWPLSATYLVVDYPHRKKKKSIWLKFPTLQIVAIASGGWTALSLSSYLVYSSALTNLIPLCGEDVIGTVDKRRALNIVCLNSRKAFDTLSHTPLITKLVRYGLDEWKMRGGGKFAQAWSVLQNPSGSSVPQRLILFNVFRNGWSIFSAG